MRQLKLLLLSFCLCLPSISFALEKVRVGVLEFGTVNWELDVMQQHKFAEQNGVDLEIVPLASADASTVALQGGAVDMIVSDWVWVARQRAAEQDYTLFPYSKTVGSVLARPQAGIKTLADLKGKKLGVAGGANDKSWLFLQAYAKKTANLDLSQAATVQYAAPPLLNELMQKGELDAVLNFWHYAARLQIDGLQTVITMPQVLEGLGIQTDLPLIGWVFSEKWASAHSNAAKGFLSASYAAKNLLKTDNKEWERLRSRMKAENDAVFTALRDAYRAGIPTCFGTQQQQAANEAFKILADTGGKALVGDLSSLPAGTFWQGFNLPACP